MKKYIVFFILMILPYVVFADTKTIDRTNGNETTILINSRYTYWIVFSAADFKLDSFYGHAFVMWRKVDDQKGITERAHAYGLYPEQSDKKVLLLDDVPGKFIEEIAERLRNSLNKLQVKVTKEMYDNSWKNTQIIRERNDTVYNLINENCVNFTDIIVRAIGLKRPTIEDYKRHPQGYIYKLKELNK